MLFNKIISIEGCMYISVRLGKFSVSKPHYFNKHARINATLSGIIFLGGAK